MINFIIGKIENISDKVIILLNNGIGYKINTSNSTISNLKIGEEYKIFTYMNVKEDGISLFGFLSEEEQSIFNSLLNVSGIGPKLAVAITDSMSPNDIIISIVSEDFKTLSKCPGVGKKTAQRIVLDLKDKFSKHKQVESGDFISSDVVTSNERLDAIEALTSLGYLRSESMKAVMEVAEIGMKTDEILKLALKKLL